MGSCCIIQGTQPGAQRWPRWVGWWGAGKGGREALEEGDICIPMDDSHCYMAETNTL